jgi:hypothetical protein
VENGPEVWRKLGIAWTRSSRTIRIAYLRKLRATDVETGAVAFIGLRDAYEAALAATQKLELVGSWQDGVRDGEGQSDYPREHAAPDAWFAVALLPRAEAFAGDLPPEIGELDLLFATVAGENRRWLSAEEKAELRRCWAALAADDGRRDAIERAVVWLIVNWGPFAVGLAAFAAGHFDWQTEREPDEDDAMLAEALWRARAIRFLQLVRRPGHSHHPAWVELTSPVVPGAARGRCDPLRVHEVQAVARSVWPEVESEFVPERVAMWKNNTADPAHPDHPRQESNFLKTLGKIAVALVAVRILWFFGAGLLAALGFIVNG